MVRRLTGGLIAVLSVAGLATASQLASSGAVGAPVRTAVGTVIPTTLQSGGTARFCGGGFAAGTPVDVSVGGATSTSTVATGNGSFCVSLQARDGDAGASRLVASGRDARGALLNVTGGVAVERSPLLDAAPRSAVGPLVSDSRPVVLEAWAAMGLLAVGAGAASIASQRRRHAASARVSKAAPARATVAAE